MSAGGQVVEPVRWTTWAQGDSVTLTATIDSGWHMTLISVGSEPIGEEYDGSFTLTVPSFWADSVRYNACNDVMCTAPAYVLVDNPIPEIADTTAPITAGVSLWTLFLLGLLGGLLAVFTPCVWPVIPMTVSFFLKKGGGWRDALLFGLSIVLIYVGVGLLVTAIFGASALNELSTNAILNLFFFALLVVFALSFFGLFEITLPDSWSTRLDSKARTVGGALGILLMAFTLVIVSFSCTGPIIGTLLVEAAGNSLPAPAVGMLGFSLALALPFALFAWFPGWMQSLPKSGAWMQSLKVTLAFVELAFSLKFFSVADQAYGWGLLPRPLFIALWAACFLGLAVYLLVRFVRTRTKSGKATALTVAFLSAAFAVYLVPGIWGAPVRAVAAFAPPMEIEGREVFGDYEEGLAYARQTGKPVLLDFTGYGCVNCRKMEQYVLADSRVKERLADFVVIELYVDSRRDDNRNEVEDGVENSRLQRERFGSNAQPFFVRLDCNGNRIGEPQAFTVNPDIFLQWLE